MTFAGVPGGLCFLGIGTGPTSFTGPALLGQILIAGPYAIVPLGAFGPNEGSFGHPGAGGSVGFADPAARVSFGYVMNRLGPHILLDPRADALIGAERQDLPLDQGLDRLAAFAQAPAAFPRCDLSRLLARRRPSISGEENLDPGF